MEGKRKTGAATITEADLQAVLRRGRAPKLAADEDKLMRMRLGAPLQLQEPLERMGQGFSDTEIELLSYEIEAYLQLHHRMEEAPASHAAPTVSRVKEKIVRALRKKN